jgi:hypothetical protein
VYEANIPSAARSLISISAHRVHQARLAQLAREAGRTTAQHIAGFERQRRHATLVGVTRDLSANLTDQAIDLFDRLVGTMFRKAEGLHARAFQADGRANRQSPPKSSWDRRSGHILFDSFDAAIEIVHPRN